MGKGTGLLGKIRSHLGAGYLATDQVAEGGAELRKAYRNYEGADRWNGEMKQILQRLEQYHAITNQQDSLRLYANIRKDRFPEASAGE